VAAIICEHHGQADAYLPSPMILATALAATALLQIVLAVFVLPLYEPIRLAEEMVVLDIISQGRVRYVCGVGYGEDEYDMFGVEFRRRGRIADEWLSVRLRAKTGQPFDHDDQKVQVAPRPVTVGGPSISWGGVAKQLPGGQAGMASGSLPGPTTSPSGMPSRMRPAVPVANRAGAISRRRTCPQVCLSAMT